MICNAGEPLINQYKSIDNSINPEASSEGALNDSHSQLIEQATPANVSPDNGGVSGANIDESNNLTALVSNRADGTVGVPELLPWHRSPVIRVHGLHDMPERRVLPNYNIEIIMSYWKVWK